MKPIVKWLRELSVVVTGIVITVGTGLWVNKKNNETDLKQYLTAIKMELEFNAQGFEQNTKWLQKSFRYANYLRSNDKGSLNKDSLLYYQSSHDGCGYQRLDLEYSCDITSAFEMFKTSGVMRQMKDRELLMSIWHTYSMLEKYNRWIDELLKVKKEEAIRESYLETEGKPITAPMQFFHLSPLPEGIVDACGYASKKIKETASKLEKALE